MSHHVTIDFVQITAFLAIWYFFTCITYGTNVPAGLFLPGMIIGCAIGQIYTMILLEWNIIDQNEFDNSRSNYIIMSCGAVMAGYTRMTYSLAVILMETGQVLNLFVPIVFSIMISNQVGYIFTRSLYERAIRGK